MVSDLDRVMTFAAYTRELIEDPTLTQCLFAADILLEATERLVSS